jgi:hypothetical protein
LTPSTGGCSRNSTAAASSCARSTTAIIENQEYSSIRPLTTGLTTTATLS